MIRSPQGGEGRGGVCVLHISIQQVQGPLLSGCTGHILGEFRQCLFNADMVEVTRDYNESTRCAVCSLAIVEWMTSHADVGLADGGI